VLPFTPPLSLPSDLEPTQVTATTDKAEFYAINSEEFQAIFSTLYEESLRDMREEAVLTSFYMHKQSAASRQPGGGAPPTPSSTPSFFGALESDAPASESAAKQASDHGVPLYMFGADEIVFRTRAYAK
jgi:hypothetical protein